MGVIRSGIFSGVSGKVGGVVGGRWKDKSYFREFVRPANPNTTPQQTQRGKMRIGVAFAKALVGQVFNKYTDKFERSMTGFNRFIKDNMALFLSPITYASIKMTNGKLWAPTTVVSEYNVNKIQATFSATDFGNNGAGTDKIYAVAYYTTNGLWHFAAAETLRSSGAIEIPMPTGLTAANMKFYIWAAKYSATSPTLLEMISNSVFDQTTLHA